MARHETASSKPDETSVANIENPTQAQDLDEFGGGWAGSGGGLPTGMGYQVFEVTDLVIPVGTDWSGEAAHSLGALDISAGGCLVAYDLYLETAAPVGDDQLTVGASIPDGSGGATGAHADVFGVTFLWGQDAGRPANVASIGGATPPEPFAVAPVLTNIGPTSAAITVVRARAAFLII